MMTVKELSNCLPTPLAVLLVGYDETGLVDWPRHFMICELATMYLEDVLRAQVRSEAGLERPQAWGTRLRWIQTLLEHQALAGHRPVLDLGPKRQAEKALWAWISLRNRWAHAGGREGGALPGRDEVIDMLTAVFSPLCDAQLVLAAPDAFPPLRGWALRGVQGLFDPPSIVFENDLAQAWQPPDHAPPLVYHDDLARAVRPDHLFLCRADYPVLPLEPFLRYRRGSHGENRVEFLSLMDDGRPVYLDTLPPPAAL